MPKTKQFTTIIFMLVVTAMLSVNIPTVKAAESPAPAAFSFWTFLDSFNGSIWSRWSCWHTVAPMYPGENTCGALITNSTTSSLFLHTPPNSVWISGRDGWSDIGRTVTLSPVAAGYKNVVCTAEIYAYGQTVAYDLDLRLEVIDSASWRYTSVKEHTIHYTRKDWEKIQTPVWTPAGKNVYIRIGITGDGEFSQKAYVDDLRVVCMY